VTVASPPTRTSAGRAFGTPVLAAAVAAVGSAIADTVIALIARGAGVSHGFDPLWPSSYLPLTVLGVLAGAVGWQIVRRRAGDPAAVLRWLVPAVVVLSLIPDIAVGAGHSKADTTWGGVAALMLMHVAVAAAAVPAYQRLMPLSRAAHGA
jgi:hypothetical protein